MLRGRFSRWELRYGCNANSRSIRPHALNHLYEVAAAIDGLHNDRVRRRMVGVQRINKIRVAPYDRALVQYALISNLSFIDRQL